MASPEARRLGWLLALALLVGIAVVRVEGGTAQLPPAPTQTAPRRDVAHAAVHVPTLEIPSVEEAPEDAPAEDGVRLEGQVIDANDQPVAGARVTAGDQVAITEADGAFAFEGLAAGHYHVTAEHDGAFAEEPSFAVDDSDDLLTLKLVRGPTLIVHVVDERGAALAGARVVVSGRAFVTPANGTVQFRGAATDDEYVDVRADHRGHVRQRVTTSPELTTIECTIALSPGSQVAGRVFDLDGTPVREAWVDLTSEDGGDLVFTDDDGRFHFDEVGSGAYTLSASSRTHVASAKLEILHDGQRDTTGMVLTVERGAEIAGVVVDARGLPVVGADVVGGSVIETTDGDGAFVIRGLEPGGHDVSASTKTMGGTPQHVEVEAHQRARVRLTLAPSSLVGIVVDARGAPVGEAIVVAVLDHDAHFLVERADVYGHFDFGGVAPGPYELYAQRTLDDAEGARITTTPPARTLRLVVPDR